MKKIIHKKDTADTLNRQSSAILFNQRENVRIRRTEPEQSRRERSGENALLHSHCHGARESADAVFLGESGKIELEKEGFTF